MELPPAHAQHIVVYCAVGTVELSTTQHRITRSTCVLVGGGLVAIATVHGDIKPCLTLADDSFTWLARGDSGLAIRAGRVEITVQTDGGERRAR